MILSIIGLIIGILIFIAGLYYFVKEKNDMDSRKIYGITMLIGLIIAVVMVMILL